MKIPVNQSAPVNSSSEIEIDAPVNKVWELLTTINDWTAWQKDISESNLNGDLKEGAEFRWKAGGIAFVSNIHTIEPKTKFGWTGRTFGASAIHNWFFKAEGERTKVYVEESLQGVLPRFFKRYFKRKLADGMKKNLIELKNASEKDN